jgi:hypothetical protein
MFKLCLTHWTTENAVRISGPIPEKTNGSVGQSRLLHDLQDAQQGFGRQAGPSAWNASGATDVARDGHVYAFTSVPVAGRRIRFGARRP